MSTPEVQTLAIDWTAIRTRLQGLESAGRAVPGSTPEQAQAVLDARARALARVPIAAVEAAELLQVVTFTVANEAYAVETRFVRRVLRFESALLTPIPGTPEVMLGVINLGGEIIAIFDCGRFLGMSQVPWTEQTRVLVFGTEHDDFGLRVDAAHEVRSLRIDEILDPPCSFEGPGRSLLRGVTADALIVLDGAAVIGDQKLVIDHGEEAGP
jgi:purine-binding chemotaxis protein CheW